jgi:hypothetical protein
MPRAGEAATGGSRRRAATEAHLQAIATINALFDRLEELSEARHRLTGVAPLAASDDPIRDAEALLHHAQLLCQTLASVRAAAIDASTHRRRSDLAADIGTKQGVLFPRAGRGRNIANVSDDDVAERDDVVDTRACPPPSDVVSPVASTRRAS